MVKQVIRMAARSVVWKKQKEKESPLMSLAADAAAPMPKRKRRRTQDDGDGDIRSSVGKSVMAADELVLVASVIDLKTGAEAGVLTTKRTRRRIVVQTDEDASSTTAGEVASSSTLSSSSSAASQGGKKKEKEQKEKEEGHVEAEGSQTIDPRFRVSKFRVFGMINQLRKDYLIDVFCGMDPRTLLCVLRGKLGSLQSAKSLWYVLSGKTEDDLRQLCRNVYERNGEVMQLALQKQLQKQENDSCLEQLWQNQYDDELKRHVDWITRREDIYALTKRILVPGAVFMVSMSVSMSGTNDIYLNDDDPCDRFYTCPSDDPSSSSMRVYQELQCRLVKRPSCAISREQVEKHTKKPHLETLKTLTFYTYRLSVEVLRKSCFWSGKTGLPRPLSEGAGSAATCLFYSSASDSDRWFEKAAMSGMQETARLNGILTLNADSSNWIAEKGVHTDNGYVKVGVQITAATLRDMKTFDIFVEGSSPLNATSTPHHHFFHSSLFHKTLLALVREFCF